MKNSKDLSTPWAKIFQGGLRSDSQDFVKILVQDPVGKAFQKFTRSCMIDVVRS